MKWLCAKRANWLLDDERDAVKVAAYGQCRRAQRSSVVQEGLAELKRSCSCKKFPVPWQQQESTVSCHSLPRTEPPATKPLQNQTLTVIQIRDLDQSFSCARSTASFHQRLSPHRYTSSSCSILTPALPPTHCQMCPLSVAVITTTFFSVVSKLSALHIPACASQSAFWKVLPISSSPF